MRWRILAALMLAALGATFWPTPSPAACPFCIDERGKTLVDDYLEASMVVYGTFKNPKLDPTGGIDNGTTELDIDKVLKNNDILKGKKFVTLPKYMPAKTKWIVFCDVYKGEINPYRGEEVTAGSQLLEYLDNSLALKDKAIDKRLRHCFDFLNSADVAVSVDAYREFAKADYEQYKDIAKKLPSATIVGWLKDEKTPNYRYGLYASLLGHCGDSKKDGDFLRAMIDDPRKRMGSGLDGMMAGYAMLQPKEGFAYLQDTLKNDQEEFHFRYAALRTLRFFWQCRTDVIGKDKILQAVYTAAQDHELADFAIDDLRTWKAWNLTDKVLDLFGKDSHNHSVVKRAILRFALSSPEKRAKTFVDEQRRKNKLWVEETEEMLRIDTPAEPKTVEPKKK
jgi:hypothetical protein